MEKTEEKKYIEKLILEKVRVKLTLKDERFYTGVIIGASANSILFADKFGSELFFSSDDIKRIIPTKDNGGVRENRRGGA